MPTYIARLFYLGTAYHGSQWQPNIRTIQGELLDAFSSWSHEEYTPDSVVFSGRTDRGVSSLGQIIRFKTEKKPRLEQINNYLPDDITLWAVSEVPSDYNPRFKVLSRHYRYYLDVHDSVLNLERIRQAQIYLIGLKDYTLLSKPDNDRKTTTTILNITSKMIDNLLIFDFYGISFLWKLVRKAVTLFKWIGSGLYPPEIIQDLLNGHNTIPGGIEPAFPECLVLVEATIPLRMKSDLRALKRIQKTIKNRIKLHERTTSMLNGFKHDFFSDQMTFY